MTNFEKIKNMSDSDFSDYVWAVFLAGRLYESRKYSKENFELFTGDEFGFKDYNDWLNKEVE